MCEGPVDAAWRKKQRGKCGCRKNRGGCAGCENAPKSGSGASKDVPSATVPSAPNPSDLPAPSVSVRFVPSLPKNPTENE
ncbi:MAG: hypothetical protein WC269_02005 [Candidatus Gracilibacteria bacterium]